MLLDSNIVIYSFDPAHGNVARFLRGETIQTSVLTKIEVMGFWRLAEDEYQLFESFFAELDLITISPEIISSAIDLRRTRKIGLADAVIAATALVYNLPLVTHNVRDFRWIPELVLIDPLTDTDL